MNTNHHTDTALTQPGELNAIARTEPVDLRQFARSMDLLHFNFAMVHPRKLDRVDASKAATPRCDIEL